MNVLDDVTFKIPLGFLQEAKEEVELITAPQITIPDYLSILHETEYVCSLEKLVLMGLEDSYTPQPSSPAPPCPPGVWPSCPPYWQMFSLPPERTPGLWEANPRRRSHSLRAADGGGGAGHVAPHSEGEGEEEGSSEEEQTSSTRASGSGSRRHGARPGCSPSPPRPSHTLTPQRRRNQLQTSLSVLETTRGGGQKTPSPPGPHPPPPASAHRPPNTRANTVDWTPSTRDHKPTQPSVGLDPRLPAPPPVTPVTPGPMGSHAGAMEAPAELLCALGPEERGLLEAVTAQGYPLHTAITALHRTGHQSPDKILSYLVSCERLCELGYDEAQVEEALEMFHYCETKAAEFLVLLSQFNEMGFHPNTIKEVLLVHGNHRESALEELMMRLA